MGHSIDGLKKDRYHAFESDLPPKLFRRKHSASNALTAWGKRTGIDVSRGYDIVPTVTLVVLEGALEHHGHGDYRLGRTE